MKRMKKMAALLLALVLCLSCIPGASAAPVADATIHTDASCSLTLYKYDFTNAAKDGVWTEDSFISTGWKESYVEEILGSGKTSTLGNGLTTNGYAIQGVEFSYLKVADIVTFSELVDGENVTHVLYGFDKTASADLLAAIGLSNGADRFKAADSTARLDATKYYYVADTLNTALADALIANATTVKDALEQYMTKRNAATMPITDENGKSTVSGLAVGLYLLVETAVPEMVTSTTNPFFVSLPMTTVSGDANSTSPEGGHRWNYDVTVYPKNETGIPTLEKTVREAQADTGKNNASSSITDGYAHNTTGSAGDVMEFQIISTLPTITSQATALTTYQLYDSLSEGLTYTRSDLQIAFFTDKSCTKQVAAWGLNSGKFTASYSADGQHMTINITAAGLAEINGDTANSNGSIYAGYSNYTMRVTYTCRLNSDASLVYGQDGNKNEVVLTWRRSNTDYYDTLIDDAHVYSFGLELTKLFSDKDSSVAAADGAYDHVKFLLRNESDGYWVTATLNAAEGVYYVTGHVSEEADATIFIPVTMNGENGKIMIKGLEDDSYCLTEMETANGYTLLRDDISIVITASDDTSRPCDIYSKDVLGVLQNDPYYAYDGGLDLSLANIPQAQLAHNYLTASATVDGNAVTMLTDDGSANAEAPLTVVNSRGFDLPQTGSAGTWMYGVFGMLAMAMAGGMIFFLLRRDKKDEKEA